MAYNHSGQPQRPNLPSIHNLNASYYPSFSPSASSSVPGMAEGSQNNGHRYAVGAGMPPQSIDQYGRTAGPSNVSDAHGVSPITQTPPETGGHPSPAPTSGSGGGGNHTGSSNNNNNKGAGSATGGSEFVKKLFNMLEDGMHNHIVSWGAKGDSFIVKDMNEFTKSILPKHFKHSNFASFVRQLNKYDFHKVKNPESNQADGHNEQLWEFKHPNFRSDMKSSLEQIKRKGPAPRKAAASTPNKADGAGISHEGCERAFNMFQQQLDTFAQDQHNLRAHVANLTRDYHGMINEVTNFRRAYVSQDHVMQNLVSVAARHDRSLGREEDPHRAMSAELQGLIAAYNDSARTSYELLEHISHRRPSLVSGRLLSGNRLVRESDQNETTPVTPSYFEADQRQQQQLLMQPPPTQQQQPMPPQPQARPPQPQHQPQPPQHQHPQTSLPHQQQQQHHSYQTNARPQPYGHQQKPSQGGSTAMPPQQQQQQQPQVQPPPPQVPSQPQPQQQQQQQPQQQQQTSSKQSSVTPQWTIRPKILLVEDDAISRKLSFKFLEVLGCTIEVAEDGVSAVNKMNTEKYDLVFMDINMPNLDGVSATTLIRQFDPMTPIISMTSNSNPNEILTYFSHGMNDILPKPFTKEGVLGMLEKHLLHFKQMQQLTEIPRALGIPDDAIESALVSTFVDPSANNPFADIVADFGLTEDPDYVSMLASLVNGNNAANNQNVPATTDGGDPASAQSSGTAVDGSAAAANTSGGFRKRDMDESEMDDGSGHKRGRYSDVI